MASALEKIMKGTLQKSESQKAFSPWWEDVEDKLLYTVMILGEKYSRISWIARFPDFEVGFLQTFFPGACLIIFMI